MIEPKQPCCGVTVVKVVEKLGSFGAGGQRFNRFGRSVVKREGKRKSAHRNEVSRLFKRKKWQSGEMQRRDVDLTKETSIIAR